MDYLKYDWVPIDLAHVTEMGQELRTAGRDIVYNLSNNAKHPLAPESAKWANAWRTTVDIADTWESVSDLGFSRDKWAPFNGPGHYNDPDMLVLGDTRWNRPHGCRLTSDEQYSHMTLWCLLSGPLLLGCDLEKLDPFTLRVADERRSAGDQSGPALPPGDARRPLWHRNHLRKTNGGRLVGGRAFQPWRKSESSRGSLVRYRAFKTSGGARFVAAKRSRHY